MNDLEERIEWWERELERRKKEDNYEPRIRTAEVVLNMLKRKRESE